MLFLQVIWTAVVIWYLHIDTCSKYVWGLSKLYPALGELRAGRSKRSPLSAARRAFLTPAHHTASSCGARRYLDNVGAIYPACVCALRGGLDRNWY